MNSGEKPKIFIWPETHNRASDKRTFNQFVNTHYKEGDTVLLEYALDRELKKNDLPELNDIEKDIRIFGWDDPNSCEHLDRISNHLNDVSKLRQASEESMVIFRPKKESFTKEELIESIERINKLFEETVELHKFYEKREYGILVTWKPLSIDTLEPLSMRAFKVPSFYDRLSLVIGLYFAVQVDRANIIRQASLIREIEKHKRTSNNLFVKCGQAHVLNYLKNPPEEIKRGVEMLHEYLESSNDVAIIFQHADRRQEKSIEVPQEDTKKSPKKKEILKTEEGEENPLYCVIG